MVVSNRVILLMPLKLGADAFVAGSAVFGGNDYVASIKSLRDAAC